MSSGAGAAWPWHGQGGAQGGTFTSRCAMLMECRYWMASPMLFMISEASEAAKKPSGAFTSRVKKGHHSLGNSTNQESETG